MIASQELSSGGGDGGYGGGDDTSGLEMASLQQMPGLDLSSGGGPNVGPGQDMSQIAAGDIDASQGDYSAMSGFGAVSVPQALLSAAVGHAIRGTPRRSATTRQYTTPLVPRAVPTGTQRRMARGGVY